REVAHLIRDNGLAVSGYAADFTTVNPVPPENRERYLELFRRQVEMAADLGSPSIRVDSVAAPGSIRNRDYIAALSHLAGIWHEAAGIAQEAGVRMVWEFEPGYVFNKPSEVVTMHEKVDHPNFRILFDTSHAYTCAVAGARQHRERETLPGGVQEFLKKLEGRVGAVHLIDSDGTLYGEETSAHLPFGKGLVNFQRLAPALLAITGLEWWCVDMCFWAGAWDLVESSLSFVRELLRRNAVAI
ncbi:MAG: sugar phosphate isomerase/epimerase, partial [Acidobacteria bacterium]|nr:sugar phosphate isomerase/epimerase [Acidobacteriota bacterium]